MQTLIKRSRLIVLLFTFTACIFTFSSAYSHCNKTIVKYVCCKYKIHKKHHKIHVKHYSTCYVKHPRCYRYHRCCENLGWRPGYCANGCSVPDHYVYDCASYSCRFYDDTSYDEDAGYNPDLSTGDDDASIDPELDIDR